MQATLQVDQSNILFTNKKVLKEVYAKISN